MGWEQVRDFKLGVLEEYRQRCGARNFVETGTYSGETVEWARHRFDNVYSVEISDVLYREACERFAGVRNVQLFHGDSGAALAQLIMPVLESENTLFWLDAHLLVSDRVGTVGDYPLERELRAIWAFNPINCTILIDDASMVWKDSMKPWFAKCEIKDDIVRLTS